MTAGGSRTAPGLVCKVGGSLLDGGWGPALVSSLRRVAPGHGILALAGGGHAADRIRNRHRRGELGQSEAHWAAIRVLDGTALRLAGGTGADLPVTTGLRLSGERPLAGAPTADGRTGASPPRPPRRLAVLAPSPLLRREDPLPHGWHVTSDSIAAWVAARCEATHLLLLKARDARPRASAVGGRSLAVDEAAGRGLVDGHLPHLLAGADYAAWLVNGRRPDRLLDFLTGDATAAARLRT